MYLVQCTAEARKTGQRPKKSGEKERVFVKCFFPAKCLYSYLWPNK